jgi:hypothetical protein
MPSRSAKRTSARSIRQRDQRDLVERGKKIPGVAEAMAAYGAVRSHVASVGPAAPPMRYATGTNR